MYNESVKSMRNRTVRLDREGDYWTEEEKQQLIRMFNDGEGITAMAIQLQRTEPACLCANCKVDPALCLYGRACPKIQEVE